MNHSPLPTLTAALAAVLVSGCLFESKRDESYAITFQKTGSVNEVAVYPERVGGEPASGVSNVMFIPFTTDADRAADTAYQDRKRPEEVRAFTSVFCITATTRYQVRFQIVDAGNRIAFQGRADFGYAGELMNLQRISPKGLQACLEWELAKTDSLYPAGSQIPGIYRWQVAFSFEDPSRNFTAERSFAIYRWRYP